MRAGKRSTTDPRDTNFCCSDAAQTLIPKVTVIETLQHRARMLKRDPLALYLAVRDPRTPSVAAAVVAWALSPFGLISDFIPVFGYLDDLIVVPLAITLALKLVSEQVMADCGARASAASPGAQRASVSSNCVTSMV